MAGDFLLITDDTYPGALQFPAAALITYLKSTESWIGSDLILLSIQQRRIILLHHEGVYFDIILEHACPKATPS